MRKRFCPRTSVRVGDISATIDIAATSKVTPTSASCAIFMRRCRQPASDRRNTALRASLANPAQLRHEIGRCLQTLFGVFFQTPLDEKVERGRDARLDLRDGIGLRRDNRGDQVWLALAFERLPPRHHLVEDGAEGEDVGARVGFLAFELLRRHVLHGAEDHPGGRGVDANRRDHGAGCRRFCLLLQFREAEVEQLGATLGQHDVAGFQIAMRDALAVRLLQGVGDRNRHLQPFVERQRPTREPRRQRVAFQILHDQEVGLAFPSDVKERADVRMVQPGDGLRLAFEPMLSFGIVRQVRPGAP